MATEDAEKYTDNQAQRKLTSLSKKLSSEHMVTRETLDQHQQASPLHAHPEKISDDI